MFYFILTTSNKCFPLAFPSSWWHFKISVNQELAQAVLRGWRGSRFGAFQEKGAHFCFLLSSSQLSFPPVLWKEKGSMSGSPQGAAGCIQKPGAGRQSAHLEVVGPWQQASFQKGKDSANTKITQRSQMWNGAASFFDGTEQGRMWREAEGAWCLASRWNCGRRTRALAHGRHKKGTAEALCSGQLFSTIKKITSVLKPHPVLVVVQRESGIAGHPAALPPYCQVAGVSTRGSSGFF